MGDVVKSPAGSVERAMIAAAVNWNPDLSQIGGDPDAALALLDDWSTPLKVSEPRGKPGPGTERLVAELRIIGAKIAPGMGEEQIKAWLAAMSVALSDLPLRVLIRACHDAIHEPMKFLNEVEGIVREKAKEAQARYDLARLNLRRFKQSMAAVTQPKLAAPPKMLTDDELQQIDEPLRRIGLGAGWLKEDADGRLSWNEEIEQ